jgi:uncharacterized protein
MKIPSQNKFPWSFVLLAFGFNWLILLPGILASQGLFTLPVPVYALVFIAQFGPSLAAFILTYRQEGKSGAVRLFKRALNVHIPGHWLAVIFLFPLTLAGSSLAVFVMAGGQKPSMPLLAQPVMILPYFLMTFFLQGPVQEEFGWRGYLLPRLQDKWGPLAASLITGALWGIWHLPAWLMAGVAQSYMPMVPYLVWVIGVSVLFTWIYNNTQGNLLAAILFHNMLNFSIALFPVLLLAPGADQRGFYLYAVLVIIAAVAVTWKSKVMQQTSPIKVQPGGAFSQRAH